MLLLWLMHFTQTSSEHHARRSRHLRQRCIVRLSADDAFTLEGRVYASGSEMSDADEKLPRLWSSHVTLRFDEIGYWSEIKLSIIKEYAAAYSTILSARNFHHVYIDGF